MKHCVVSNYDVPFASIAKLQFIVVQHLNCRVAVLSGIRFSFAKTNASAQSVYH